MESSGLSQWSSAIRAKDGLALVACTIAKKVYAAPRAWLGNEHKAADVLDEGGEALPKQELLRPSKHTTGEANLLGGAA